MKTLLKLGLIAASVLYGCTPLPAQLVNTGSVMSNIIALVQDSQQHFGVACSLNGKFGEGVSQSLPIVDLIHPFTKTTNYALTFGIGHNTAFLPDKNHERIAAIFSGAWINAPAWLQKFLLFNASNVGWYVAPFSIDVDSVPKHVNRSTIGADAGLYRQF